MPMRIRLVCILIAFACSQGVFAQAPEPDPKKKFSRAGLPNAKSPLTSATIRRPVTLNQVERDTGGKVEYDQNVLCTHFEISESLAFNKCSGRKFGIE